MSHNLDGFEALLMLECETPPIFAFESPEQAGRISVIIPLYNGAAFLEQTLHSVWEQTLDPARIEIVLADDGSTDGSLELAQRLQAESPCAMQVLTHPDHANRGVSATRNLCLRHAQGQYIALLDADDQFLPRRLEASLAHFAAHPECDALGSFGINVDESGKPVTGYNGTSQAGNYRDLEADLDPPFTFEQLWVSYPIVNSSISLRRRAAGEVGGYPETMAHQAEDWFLMLLISLQSPIACIEESLMRYTHHPGSYTTLYHIHQFDKGARYEVLLHVVSWMSRRPAYRERGMALFRKEYPLLASTESTPNLTHLPLILKNAWKTFRRVGPVRSARMLTTTLCSALRRTDADS